MKTIYIIFLLGVLISCRQNEQQSNDWAYLKKYEAANKALPARQANEQRVVFIGNSITESWIYVDPLFFKNNSFINRGISGQTTPQMLVRFSQDVIQLNPDIVVILAGTNDIAENTGPITIENIARNIISMAQLARANNIEPVICTLLPAEKYYWNRRADPKQKIPKLNALLREYCSKNNIGFVDYYSAMVDSKLRLNQKFTEDGIHPNLHGYNVMKSLTEKAIESALKKREAKIP
jgi:lysophospholipase L1-like esterase